MRISTALLILALGATPSLAQGVGARCTVLDPTATPLNIRTTPNGQIVGQIDNMVNVVIRVIKRDERGRIWALVSLEDEQTPLGWVFHDYLICSLTR